MICHLQRSWNKTTQQVIWLEKGYTSQNVPTQLILSLRFGSWENTFEFASLDVAHFFNYKHVY
jgi:hypothetical protein